MWLFEIRKINPTGEHDLFVEIAEEHVSKRIRQKFSQAELLDIKL